MRIKLCGLIACAAMLAAGVVSCQQHDDIPQGVKYPILFDSPDTRATATIDDLKKGFMVYAFVDGNAGSTSFAKEVTHSVVEGRDIWALETPEYWLPDTDYYFKAFYPSVPSAGTLTVDNTDKNQDFKITNFDITKQEDIMVASATARVDAGALAPTNGSVVPLEFEHLLACVTIAVKSEIKDVTINSLTLNDINDNGSYNGEWNSSNSGSITINSATSLVAGDDKYTDVSNGGFLVIPAKISGVTLTINASNKTYENIEIPAITWQKGMKYTYRVDIKQNDIVFNDPNVAKWDSDSATGSVIIK